MYRDPAEMSEAEFLYWEAKCEDMIAKQAAEKAATQKGNQMTDDEKVQLINKAEAYMNLASFIWLTGRDDAEQYFSGRHPRGHNRIEDFSEFDPDWKNAQPNIDKAIELLRKLGAPPAPTVVTII